MVREIEQRVYSSRSLKLQSGYALLPFQTPGSFSALVGIHLKNEKSCLKKGPTAYIHDITKRRLIEVLRREAESFQNTRLIYAEMMQWNAILLKRICNASNQADVAKIYDQMKTTGYLRYGIDLSRFDTNNFSVLPLEDQKKILIDCLDKNHLYVNLGDIGDEAYCVSENDLHLNHIFYENKK